MKKSSENIAGFFRWTTQPNLLSINYIYSFSCVYPVKLKNLKANHNNGAIVIFLHICIFVLLAFNGTESVAFFLEYFSFFLA